MYFPVLYGRLLLVVCFVCKTPVISVEASISGTLVAGGGGPHFAPPASIYLLVPSLQGEWNRQPLPEIVSRLEEPTPHCPASQAQSPAGPTVLNIGGGKG